MNFYLILIVFASNVLGQFNFNVCNDWDELSTDEINKIKSASNEILSNMKNNKMNLAWAQCHDIFKQATPKAQFMMLGLNIRQRLTSIDSLEFDDGRLMTITGDLGFPQQMVCGSVNEDDPNHVKFPVQPGIEKTALIIYKIPTEPISRRVILILGSDENDEYKLIFFNFSPYKYQGRESKYFLEISNKLTDEKSIFSKYLCYQISYLLSAAGSSVQYQRSNAIMKKISEIETDKNFQSKFQNWTINNESYRIYKITFIETLKDISPVVYYLSKHKLSEKSTIPEAKNLLPKFKSMFPEIINEFDAVLFQAYSEDPIDPQKQYPIYRVPLSLH